MGQHNKRFRLKLIAGAAAMMWLPAASAFEPFTIREIRAEGLERLDVGTVLTYLPLSVGDQLTSQTSRQAMRGLYSSGLFEDVRLESDGDTLVIFVKERPAISKFEIEGNKKIGGDELMDSLKNLGLTEGELFKRELLDGVEQELQRQYYANGYYDVQIKTTVEPLPNNRVDLKIDVTEGKVTTIRDINILGNNVYSREELFEAFKLDKTNRWEPLQKSDKYSKQQLGGDLESLSSYYQDRGYLKFEVASVQVQLSPTKEDIYITINVEEGDRYKIKDTKFSGDTILQSDFLKLFLSTKPTQWFSRKEATESANRIEAALSDVGYAFAKVTPLPEIDENTKEITLNYYVEPGKRAYVRRINFSGHGRTHDETLRREMRQLEAAPFSKSSVERSRVRLARLPFVEEAEVETQPVPGSDDLVDINFKVKERPPGSIQFGVGFSGSQGFLITGSVTHTNFLGTGNRVSLEVSNNSVSKAASASWTDPYFTNDGVSQTVSVFYRKADSVIRQSSGFNYNTIGTTLTYGIPLSEYSALRAGFGIETTAIDTFANSTSDQVLEFVIDNGTRYTDFEFRTGISRDTRNRTFFASRGSLQSLTLDARIPGSDLEFATATYRMQQYIPLPFKFFVEFNANVAASEDYGSGKSQVPPYENFFAGGSRTVRGFDDGSLGPRDTPFDNPFGGRLRTTSQTEIVIPTPFESDQKSTRVSFFYDIGQVYKSPKDFDADKLKNSAGIAFQWFTPFLGLLDLSYAYPLNDESSDDTERFQINFGTGF
ncbi:Beta-barrel assembly machine subunit BamA [Panacagrimonas perspica]|uniref:Outer membrane protein assembly factor BamA n=1 Tax=Panacagrimonas perspica TaxID=381431 RepID=A0A4R7PB81_9GAMM|nr:outer membrane protein assembly factor BamA [Panacagrimonas perspica]TDU31218.1 Beta-barrel assembly machine subunit BamA [Panacagrimonas perspica]